jgi:membrane-associated protein
MAPFFSINIAGGLGWAIGVSALGYWLGNTIPNIDHYILPILGIIGLLALSPTLVRLLRSRVTQRNTRA